MQAKNERVELRLDSQLLDHVDEWRSEQSDVPSRSEAMRRLLDMALSQTASQAEFELARLQIKAIALTPGAGNRISDGYLYAWDRGVYPIFHSDELIKPFAAYFPVSKEALSKLLRFLDEQMLKDRLYTFYQLEDYFRIRHGDSEWDRSTLIGAFRYMFLTKNFERKFWDTLLTPMEHPSEARSIIGKFDRDEDIYFN